jgi:hypothetical protein
MGMSPYYKRTDEKLVNDEWEQICFREGYVLDGFLDEIKGTMEFFTNLGYDEQIIVEGKVTKHISYRPNGKLRTVREFIYD